MSSELELRKFPRVKLMSPDKIAHPHWDVMNYTLTTATLGYPNGHRICYVMTIPDIFRNSTLFYNLAKGPSDRKIPRLECPISEIDLQPASCIHRLKS
jgi:hypothetical protein